MIENHKERNHYKYIVYISLHNKMATTQNEVSTYLGQKGYTVFKECLDGKEQRTIRSDLNVRPYIPKSPIQPPSYPVFRESPLKYYLPRYYE